MNLTFICYNASRGTGFRGGLFMGNITIIGDHESELATAIFNSIEFKEPK